MKTFEVIEQKPINLEQKTIFCEVFHDTIGYFYFSYALDKQGNKQLAQYPEFLNYSYKWSQQIYAQLKKLGYTK